MAQTTSAGRIGALGVIRIVALAIAVVTAAIGIALFVMGAVGPVLWMGQPGVASGWVELPFALRLVHAGVLLLWALTAAGMALITADLVWRMRQGIEFAPAVTRSVWAYAIVLAAGSWLAQIALNLAGQAGLLLPDEFDLATVDWTVLPINWGIGWHTFLPNPALLGLSVVLGILAFVIQSGERLQRDVQGLV